MNLHTHGPCRLASWSGLLCLLLLGLPSHALSAPPSDAGAAPAAFAPAPVPAAPVLFAEQSRWSWTATYQALAQFLSNRGHLIQFCTVGMVVALFVIMRNKW